MWEIFKNQIADISKYIKVITKKFV